MFLRTETEKEVLRGDGVAEVKCLLGNTTKEELRKLFVTPGPICGDDLTNAKRYPPTNFISCREQSLLWT